MRRVEGIWVTDRIPCPGGTEEVAPAGPGVRCHQSGSLLRAHSAPCGRETAARPAPAGWGGAEDLAVRPVGAAHHPSVCADSAAGLRSVQNPTRGL